MRLRKIRSDGGWRHVFLAAALQELEREHLANVLAGHQEYLWTEKEFLGQ